MWFGLVWSFSMSSMNLYAFLERWVCPSSYCLQKSWSDFDQVWERDILVYSKLCQGNLVWFRCSQILNLHHSQWWKFIDFLLKTHSSRNSLLYTTKYRWVKLNPFIWNMIQWDEYLGKCNEKHFWLSVWIYSQEKPSA